jgi:hypothetical protein
LGKKLTRRYSLVLTEISGSKSLWPAKGQTIHTTPKCMSALNGPPRNWQLPQELITHLSNFKQALKDTVNPRRCASNLLPHQHRALKHLRNQSDFIVAQCNKNLGHSVIEKDEYTKMALNDHLLDPNTYHRLSPLEARMAHGQIRTIIKDWIKAYKYVLSKNEEQFLKRSLAQNKDPFGTLYLLIYTRQSFPLAPLYLAARASFTPSVFGLIATYSNLLGLDPLTSRAVTT